MDYRITGLPSAQFSHLYGLDVAALAAHGVTRYAVNEVPGFPDRVGLRDLDIGEHALLINYTHQDAETPYRASHAIFVAEGAVEHYDRVNEIPQAMRIRPLSVRAFSFGGMMLDADLIDGTHVESLIERLLSLPEVDYLHVHYAKRGCFAARVTRA